MTDETTFTAAGHPADDPILSIDSSMARLMRTIDWGSNPLGPVSSWSQSLRTSVSICLNSRFPILIWWGPDHIMLYNDAYRPILGTTKHPRAMGQIGQECWPEIWHIIGPMLEGVVQRGLATWSEDQLLLLDRNGFLEECYFTFSYSPIHDENGIGGIFTAVTETTDRVVSERRMGTLARLSAQLAAADSEPEACRSAVQLLSANRHDLPFAAIYLLDEQGKPPRLVGSMGFTRDLPEGADIIVRAAEARANGGPWSFPPVLSIGPLVPDQLLHQILQVPSGSQQPVTQMKILPLGSPDAPFGFLLAGISPYRSFDPEYQSFFALIAGEITSGIANLRTLESERKRVEALAELDRAKTEFFSNISHEFRTPITLMLAPLQDALNDTANPLTAPHRERLEIVFRSGLRLLKLVNSLLDFSRIEAGRARASFQPIDLAQMTRELASVFRSPVEHAGLSLVIDCPPLPEAVFVDPDLWEKIVLNLLSNAFKYTFEGQISVSLQWKGSGVELCVADTGVGIAAENLPLIFQRFHRIEGVRTRSIEGSGIGLALVQELVRQHGGSITVTSQVNRGSSFCVSIPAGSAHLPPEYVRTQPASPHLLNVTLYVEEARRWLPGEPVETVNPDLPLDSLIPALPHETSPSRILIVDDNLDMLDYLRRILSARWTVETASNGLEALQAVQRSKPDLILSDIMIPGIDGFELLHQVREDPALRDTPFILVSARAGEEARTEGLEHGADDYLVKPFSTRELIARVESTLALFHMRTELHRKITGILDSMTAPFWAVDPTWCISYINHSAQQLVETGAPLQAGTNLRPFLQSFLSEANWSRLEQAMSERRPLRFEQLLPGQRSWLEFRVSPFENGLAIHAVDVTTEKLHAESQRQVDLQRHLLENRENERQELARDLHDGPIQSLVSTIFNIQYAREIIQDPTARLELEQIQLGLKSTVRELRSVVTELRPPVLIRFGFVKTIRVSLADLQEKHPEISFQLDLQEDENLLSEPVCLALYRIFQEGMNNILRHSGANQVGVAFQITPEQVLFELADNGKGFTPADYSTLTQNGHYGLAGMQERVEAVRGALSTRSTPGQGTLLRVTIPWAAARRET